jgi:hypothetical protein
MKQFKTLVFIGLSTLLAPFLHAQSAPPNNTCGGAQVLFAFEDCAPDTFSTENATETFGAGFCDGVADDDVWFRFLAISQIMEIRVNGHGFFDPVVQHFIGNCNNLLPQLCQDGTGAGGTEILRIEDLVPNQVYYFRVFDYNAKADQIDYTFDVCVVEEEVTPLIPSDFPCIAADPSLKQAVDGNIYFYNNELSGVQPGETVVTPSSGVCDPYDFSGWCSDDGLQNTAWIAFDAPASGSVFIDACNQNVGTAIETQMALYSATDCNEFTSFTLLAANEVSPDCGPGSQLSYCTLTPGETYFILVDGFEGASGNFGLSITSIEEFSAGMGSAVDVCKNNPAFDLFSALSDADPGGIWLDLDNSGGLISGTFNAFSTPSGTYTFGYLIEGFACFDNDTAFVTCTTPALGNPGTPGGAGVCTNVSDFALFPLLGGSPDAGGIWRDPNGALHSGIFDGSTDPEGTYLYIIPSATPGTCPGDSVFSTVLVQFIGGGDPGESASVSKCTNDAPFIMTDFLGGTPDEGGQWFDFNSNEVDELFDPATDPAGNYFYVVTPPGCSPEIAQLAIFIQVGPDAGLDATETLCSSASSVNLGSLLGGSPDLGGTWFDPSGTVTSNIFSPISSPPGLYTYVVASAGCPNDSAFITMQVEQAVHPGADGDTAVCYNAEPFNLFLALGGMPDAGGTWKDPNGQVVAGTFDPASSAVGTYTYVLQGNVCDPDSSTVEVTRLEAAMAGEDAAFSSCENDPPTILSPLLGNQAMEGGTWFNPSGQEHSGTFDPAVDEAGNYTYVVAGPCNTDTAKVEATLLPTVFAGDDASITACENDPSTALFPLLGDQAMEGGTWYNPAGGEHGSSFDPAADEPGTYTYVLGGDCNIDSAEVAVFVTLLPFAGTALDEDTLVNDETSIDLFSLLEDPDMGGTWSDNDNAGTLEGSTFSGNVGQLGNTYQFTYSVSNDCGTSEATVSVFVDITIGLDEYQPLEFRIFPNPAQERVFIQSDQPKGEIIVSIFDLSGRVVFQSAEQLHNGQLELSLQAMPKGTYLLEIENEQGIQGVKTLIKH